MNDIMKQMSKAFQDINCVIEGKGKIVGVDLTLDDTFHYVVENGDRVEVMDVDEMIVDGVKRKVSDISIGFVDTEEDI